MAAEVFQLPNSQNLSLTLIEESFGAAQDGSGLQQSMQALYVGAATGANITEQPTGCALMLQYQMQTFRAVGNDSDEATARSTDCGDTLGENCITSVVNAIQSFPYSSNDTGSVCDLLIQHVNVQLRTPALFCDWIAGYVNVTGGTISGPDASTASVEDLQPDSGCQPVVPQDFELHNAAEAWMILSEREDSFAAFDEDVPSTASWSGGKRWGRTPVATVSYTGANNGETYVPEVQMTCMRSYLPDGGFMPSQLQATLEGGAASLVPNVVLVLGLGVVGIMSQLVL